MASGRPERPSSRGGTALAGGAGAALGSGGRTSCVSSRASGCARTTMTSSSRSKCADGATRMSLKSPPVVFTECTRPTMRPLGNMRSRPEVTTTSPTTTSASTGTNFMASRLPTWSANPACPDTTAVMRLRSMRTPSPLSLVEQELHPRRVRPHRDHAPHHARGADDGRVEGDPVRAARG